MPKQDKNLYPSKEEIINTNTIHTLKDIMLLQAWKVEFYTKRWSQLNNDKKLLHLYFLTETITKDIQDVHRVHYKLSNEYAVNLKSRTLYFKKDSPSIISTLHEIGHLFYGASELKACVFSYKLFRTVFPNECKKLTWEGHMLVKKQLSVKR